MGTWLAECALDRAGPRFYEQTGGDDRQHYQDGRHDKRAPPESDSMLWAPSTDTVFPVSFSIRMSHRETLCIIAIHLLSK
jgi:hypothetical protein